jgi:hypothetical protein
MAFLRGVRQCAHLYMMETHDIKEVLNIFSKETKYIYREKNGYKI